MVTRKNLDFEKESIGLTLAGRAGNLSECFRNFDISWVIDYRFWRSEYVQPVTEKNYSSYVPGRNTPFKNVHISTMAQIYPEDRGTNYAIREGRIIVEKLLNQLSNSPAIGGKNVSH